MIACLAASGEQPPKVDAVETFRLRLATVKKARHGCANGGIP